MKFIPVVVAMMFVNHVVRGSVFQFNEMINCTTGSDGVRYLGYGCYCGPGGSGQIMDNIDRCCHSHDKCYDDAAQKCPSVEEQYLSSYTWECIKGANETIPNCTDHTSCGTELCKCDAAAARCFAKYELPALKPVCNNGTKTGD